MLKLAYITHITLSLYTWYTNLRCASDNQPKEKEEVEKEEKVWLVINSFLERKGKKHTTDIVKEKKGLLLEVLHEDLE